MSDGEDFELLFTLSHEDAEKLVGKGLAGTPVTMIGRVTMSEEGCNIIFEDGIAQQLDAQGFEHHT